jgi:pimeloyl-ACP methyl ester carboxylesterase
MRLNFQLQGDGVPITLVHGFVGEFGHWRVMSKRFAAHFKVYSLDLTNHGASPHSPVMHYAAMADDVREFFTSENIDRAHLLGHSMGGKVAMQFAADNAGSVDGLVVVDIAPKAYPPAHKPLLAALKALDLAKCKSYGDADRALAGNIPDPLVRQFLITNLARGADAGFYWRIGLAEIIANYDVLTEAVRPIAPSPPGLASFERVGQISLSMTTFRRFASASPTPWSSPSPTPATGSISTLAMNFSGS